MPVFGPEFEPAWGLDMKQRFHAPSLIRLVPDKGFLFCNLPKYYNMTTCTHGAPTNKFCKQCEMEQDLALSAAGSIGLKDWMEKPLPEVKSERAVRKVVWDIEEVPGQGDLILNDGSQIDFKTVKWTPNFETVNEFQVPLIWIDEEE